MGEVTAKSHNSKINADSDFLILVKETMGLLSGKWKIQIITFLLRNGTTRYMNLQRGVCGISAKILSKELQELEQRNMVSRTVLNPKLTSVEYELTEHGKTLEVLIRSIADWGATHLEQAGCRRNGA